jgi:hypothetical protein
MGLLRRPTPGEIVEGGRLARPCGPGAHSRASQKTKPRLRHFHLPIRGPDSPRYRRVLSQKTEVNQVRQADESWADFICGCCRDILGYCLLWGVGAKACLGDGQGPLELGFGAGRIAQVLHYQAEVVPVGGDGGVVRAKDSAWYVGWPRDDGVRLGGAELRHQPIKRTQVVVCAIGFGPPRRRSVEPRGVVRHRHIESLAARHKVPGQKLRSRIPDPGSESGPDGSGRIQSGLVDDQARQQLE